MSECDFTVLCGLRPARHMRHTHPDGYERHDKTKGSEAPTHLEEDMRTHSNFSTLPHEFEPDANAKDLQELNGLESIFSKMATSLEEAYTTQENNRALSTLLSPLGVDGEDEDIKMCHGMVKLMHKYKRIGSETKLLTANREALAAARINTLDSIEGTLAAARAWIQEVPKVPFGHTVPQEHVQDLKDRLAELEEAISRVKTPLGESIGSEIQRINATLARHDLILACIRIGLAEGAKGALSTTTENEDARA